MSFTFCLGHSNYPLHFLFSTLELTCLVIQILIFLFDALLINPSSLFDNFFYTFCQFHDFIKYYTSPFNSNFYVFYFQARKALRALKGLVKIQALVRGYLVRKRAAATLHSMQALIRAQTAVRTQRARRSMSKEDRFLPEVLARKPVVIKNWFSSPE